MSTEFCRRTTLLGLSSAAFGAAVISTVAAESPIAHDANELQSLSTRLGTALRRRDFKTVPMILDHPDLWDAAALNEVMGYRGAGKQVWNNTAIAGSWLNLMRNSLNTQVFSFRHPDFLAVSATHRTAHLALFDQETWDKYQFAKLARADFQTNTLILAKQAASAPSDFENPESVFGPAGATIPALQSRGVMFLACHNEIWEVAERLLGLGINPDHLSHETIAAELTNHLIDGVVLTPGIGGTIPGLQRAGFHYAA